jgi:hypothetical protein
LGNNIQTKDTKNKDKKVVVEESEKKASEKPESEELQKVIKERIEKVKKAFRPTGLAVQLNSQESKKGK